MKYRSRLVGNLIEFFGVVGIPTIYMVNLYLIAYYSSVQEQVWMMGTGLVVALVGIGIWILSYISLGKSFGVLPKSQKRVVGGIYRHLKHPMYVGIMLTYVGLATANGSRSGLGFSLLVLLPILVIRAYLEEKELSRYARTTRS